MLRGRFSRIVAHRGGLCVAVAALMPVPTALSGQPLPQIAAPASAFASSAHAASVPVVPVTVDVPPRVKSTDGHHADAGKHKPHKTRAVIHKTQHERILDISANTSYDVPLAALNAYQNAASRVASSYPSCHLSWGVIAAIGQVESGHGRFGGASVLANGMTAPRIVGPELNGRGPVAAIHDTDNGVYDGDKVWDRAVGPMQFIPSTWAVIGVDGDGDGHRNPSDFDDAALSTGIYLCGAGGDFSSLAQARANVMRYNHSEEYVDLVLRIANAYDSGVVDVVPNDPAPPPRVRHPHHRPHPHHTSRPGTTRPHGTNPTPHQPGQPNPQPKPDPTPDPKPDPTPDPPKPVVKHYYGVWTWVSATSGKVGSVSVALPLSAAVKATLTGDVDGDGTTELLANELEGLSGGSVAVTTTDGRVTAFSVTSTPPPPPTPSTASPSAAAPTTYSTD
jgi:membrane-bound lytic murein transglycosylase B